MPSFQEQTLAYLKGELNAAERASFEEALTTSEALRAELESSRELLDLLQAADEEAIVRQVNTLIQQALAGGAGDIHIVPERDATVVHFRIDGHLQEAQRSPAEASGDTCAQSAAQQRRHQAIIARLKVMAECNVAERRVPQDGRIAVRYQGTEYDLWLNVLPTINGERATVRIHNRSNALIGLDKLGLQSGPREAIERLVRRPYGLLLVAGLAGSGKTTLMYSMLHAASAPEGQKRNIQTIEDRVALALTGVSQTAVNRPAELTYAAALRAFFRSDPDMVMVGELRSLECAELSVELALARCLVVSQLHVPSALSVVQRLQDMGIVRFLIAHFLAGAIGVRLIRRLCPDCIVEYKPEPDVLRKAGLSLNEDGPFRRGAGCVSCHHTGYKGRLGLFEVLEVDQRLRQRLAENVPVETLWHETFGRTGGSLWDDARDKVRQGLTTVEEVAWALFDYPHPATTVAAFAGTRYEIGSPPQF